MGSHAFGETAAIVIHHNQCRMELVRCHYVSKEID